MVTRRHFLTSTLLAGAGMATGCRPNPPLSRERSPGAPPPAFGLEEFSLSELQAAMESDEHTSRSITELYLGRIDQCNVNGPSLRAVIETNPDALEIADSLDQERALKGARGPLHGIPVLIKDNIDTADGMTTTAGSLALEGSVPPEDAFVVRRLRAAGAVILGKANLSEWANFRSRNSSSGWSARGGQCRNPYVLDFNPCGSSSGSAVAVSANLASIALGTETNGSILCPASRNGIVGLKPTLGLLSRTGVIPIAESQDTVGPMTRSVRDAALLLQALAAPDPRDPATLQNRGNSETRYAGFLEMDGLAGARLGVARNFDFDRSVWEVFETAVEVMRRSGAQIVDPADVPNIDRYRSTSYTVMLYEFKSGLNRYLQSPVPDRRVTSLLDIIEFNERNRDREMPFFGQDIFVEAESMGRLDDPAYLNALENNRRFSRAEGIDATLNRYNLDAVIAPTGGPAWLTDHINGDQGTGSSTSPAAVAGYPSITVPMGFVADLPLGLSFFGKPWTEPALFRLAFAYEQASHHRRPPRFLAS